MYVHTTIIHHQSVLPKGRFFTANSGTKAAVLPKGRSSAANSETRFAVLLVMNRCGSLPLLSAYHSLFSIWTDFKRSEKVPSALTWRWGEWIWLTEPSGLHRNSPKGLISAPSGFCPDQRSGNPNYPSLPSRHKIPNFIGEKYNACSSALCNFLHFPVT